MKPLVVRTFLIHVFLYINNRHKKFQTDFSTFNYFLLEFEKLKDSQNEPLTSSCVSFCCICKWEILMNRPREWLTWKLIRNADLSSFCWMFGDTFPSFFSKAEQMAAADDYYGNRLISIYFSNELFNGKKRKIKRRKATLCWRIWAVRSLTSLGTFQNCLDCPTTVWRTSKTVG